MGICQVCNLKMGWATLTATTQKLKWITTQTGSYYSSTIKNNI